jgi:shikimate kinase
MTALYLIGYRCTGKSTIGKLVADLMDLTFIDTDRTIETKVATTIEEMVSQRGWDYFREKEKQALFNTSQISNLTSNLTSNQALNQVVATGGGIVMDPDNRNFMQTNGVCIWLYADHTTIVHRILSDTKNLGSRPNLTSHSLAQETRKMLELRNPLYEKLGLIKIDTSCHSPEQAADIIKRRFSHVRQ